MIAVPEPPPGWHYDEDTGALMRDVIHRMGRRCRDWDYGGRAIYLITICLKERGRPILAAWPVSCASPETAKFTRPKTLGDVIRGFKTGCREVGWQEGYVDSILFRRGQLQRMLAYLHDNPRRLWEKRTHPELFRVLGRRKGGGWALCRHWQQGDPECSAYLPGAGVALVFRLSTPAF